MRPLLAEAIALAAVLAERATQALFRLAASLKPTDAQPERQAQPEEWHEAVADPSGVNGHGALWQPDSCPRCRGQRARDGEIWRCAGVPDEAWAARMLEGPCRAIGRPVGAADIAGALQRPPCGWTGQEASRGVLWA